MIKWKNYYEVHLIGLISLSDRVFNTEERDTRVETHTNIAQGRMESFYCKFKNVGPSELTGLI